MNFLLLHMLCSDLAGIVLKFWRFTPDICHFTYYVKRICNLLLGCLCWGVWNGAVTVSQTETGWKGVTPVLLLCSQACVFWCCFLSKHRERRKNVHTHVSIVQREGPGYALFSTDGSRGGGWGGDERGCVHVCWGGLLEYVFPLSVNKQTPPWSEQPRWQDTPLCLHVHSLLILFIYQLISPVSFYPSTWQA